MDHSNSLSSNAASGSRSAAPFAYQTRLLERTSSRSGGQSLSRSNSQSSSFSLLTNTTGSSLGSVAPRRWTSTHRVTNSVDAVRSKWEERTREALFEEESRSHPDKTDPTVRVNSSASTLVQSVAPQDRPFSDSAHPIFPIPLESNAETHAIPKYLKRQTMPAIITSPLSPNSTGILVEADSPLSSTPQRIRIPIPESPSNPASWRTHLRETRSSSPTKTSFIPNARRTETREATSPNKSKINTVPKLISEERRPPFSNPEQCSTSSIESIHVSHNHRALVRNDSIASSTPETPRITLSSPASPVSSVMYPTTYRSSYMANKKAGTFESLSVAGSRGRLGNHLPRIASGDGEDLRVLEPKKAEEASFRTPERTRLRDHRFAKAIQEKKLTPSGVLTNNGVAGLPGRISLKAPSQDTTPASNLLGGSWADKQRHLLQAYEYLCHVGEAQQWIEGCLGEELECGVVELEDALQNGVILARLVRVFQGEAVVKKIYEGGTKRFDFRHSENINHFFRFVREVGLPEESGFIFELTDLYEKKNLPKVIYCLHALSHLLAHRGLAPRIGNLLGRLHFSDDQLIRTQQGLKDAGVAMPNFGNVGKELAKEINAPAADEETEDEKRDRMLLECESSIIALQTQARGFLVRRSVREHKNRTHLAERHILKFQTHLRGVLARKRLSALRKEHGRLTPWVIVLQARARGILVRGQWHSHLLALRRSTGYITRIQAQVRGVLQRRRYQQFRSALRKIQIPTKRLQAVARGHILRCKREEIIKSFISPKVSLAVVALQAHARGALIRSRVQVRMHKLSQVERSIIMLQAQSRGLITRRRLRTQLAKLKNVTDIVVGIQAAVRTYLARKRLLMLIRGLRRASPVIAVLQARARGKLIRQTKRDIQKALTQVQTIKVVGSLQALARAAIVRKQHHELDKKLDIALPDVVRLQAAGRGALLRAEFYAWRDHLHRNEPVAVILQAMFRGVMQRRVFREKMDYYRSNLNKVIKIQSLFRAKETREQYRQLTLGKNVSVGTIKNFVHLLDDSEADFQDEIKVERLRKRVVEAIRENQALENDINDLDKTIGLVVHNLKTVEDVLKARKKYGGDSSALNAARVSLLAAHGDIFSAANTLDQEAHRKLELYQQLFYILQTRSEYLTELLSRLSSDDTPETNRRFMERAVLTLFGYGQDRREDFLLLKLFQHAVRDEVANASSPDSIIFGRPLYINISAHYIRSRQVTYLKESLQSIIRELIETDDLDLEADPSKIHRARIEVEEMRSGKTLNIPKDILFKDAVTDPDTRAIYIRHLQLLQWWTEACLNVIIQSTKKMPYSMRYLARETLIAIREKFPGSSNEVYGACLGRLIFYRYICPPLEAPESFDIIPKSMSIVTGKKNLSQISKVLAQVTSGLEFSDDEPSYVPINDFVRKAIPQMSAWFLEVANVADAETRFHAHEFMDATVQPKPIYISPNEIYHIHSMLVQHQNHLGTGNDDALRVILTELGGVPHLDNEELKDARDTQVTLELTNRFAHVQDPHAEEKTLWVQAKRGVLAILRVQPAQDLLESLMRPVTEKDELLWEEILEMEMENEMRQMPRRQPSTMAYDSVYRLEDIRSLKFAAVKALAISNLLELEKQGNISREDGFQGILNAIAGDVRSKHRKRLQRHQEMQSMNEALCQLAARKKYFQEQLDSYHAVVESAMNTMQRGKGKKRFVVPFTKQFYHLRDLQKTGQAPQFGSYIYSAKELYDRSILLSIDQYSPRQFDKLQITLSSNVAGVFNVCLESTILGVTSRIAAEDIRMEDLLQAKYEKRPSLSLLDGKVKVNFELFLYQINKKFYS